jgi:hemerythrin-like domain-containing protein
MTSIATLMTHDHRACDHDFARAETLAAKGDWVGAQQALGNFSSALEAHFHAEETTLFPAFEAATGMTNGPTAVMRGEHTEMRSALENLARALATHDADEFAGEAETLMIMMQQHNMKEESVLYPMCDAHLSAHAEEITGALAQHIAREHHA